MVICYATLENYHTSWGAAIRNVKFWEGADSWGNVSSSHVHPFSKYLSSIYDAWCNWFRYISKQKKILGTSLVAQWLGIRLPMQGTRVRALVREDPTCCGATGPASHNYWAHVPQLLKPACLEPVLCNERGHHSEKPIHHDEEWPQLAATREGPRTPTKTQCSQK